MPAINPWKTLNKKEIYENPWIRLEHHDVLTPRNTAGIYGCVHFKNTAVGIIPYDECGNTWLVGQFRYTLNAYSWEIPMGGCPIGTDPEAGAHRELLEETGLDCRSLTKILTLHTSNSVTDEIAYVYLARELTQKEVQFDDTEQIEIQKLPLDHAFDWALNGRITDAISVAGLLKLKAIGKDLLY